MEFQRTSRRSLNLPLTPLIDVVFILIIFFMLTVSFLDIESLEISLPSSGKVEGQKEITHIYIKENGDVLLGKRLVTPDELNETLVRLFSHDKTTPVMLLTADGVTMQQLVAVMDKVTGAGGKSMFVRKWDNPKDLDALEPSANKDVISDSVDGQ